VELTSADATVRARTGAVIGRVRHRLTDIVEVDDLMVSVEWGDGASDTVTSGFPDVRLDHAYTGDGEFTIVLEARNASGQSVTATTVASITAFGEEVDASDATRDDDSGGEGSGTGGSNGRGGSGGGSPPPAPSPAPSPEPAHKEPAPEPVPEPVSVNLLDDDIVDNFEFSDRDGAGGSAEAVPQGPHGFGLRASAWHGLDGTGEATGKLRRDVNARSVLADMPDNVTDVTAEVVRLLARWLIDVRGHHRLVIDPVADAGLGGSVRRGGDRIGVRVEADEA